MVLAEDPTQAQVPGPGILCYNATHETPVDLAAMGPASGSGRNLPLNTEFWTVAPQFPDWPGCPGKAAPAASDTHPIHDRILARGEYSFALPPNRINDGPQGHSLETPPKIREVYENIFFPLKNTML